MSSVRLSTPVRALAIALVTGAAVACLAPLVGEPVEERAALWVMTERALVRVGLDDDGTHRTTEPVAGAATSAVRVRGNRLVTARNDALTSHGLRDTLQLGDGGSAGLTPAPVLGLAVSGEAERIWLARPVRLGKGPGTGRGDRDGGSSSMTRITALSRDLVPAWQRQLPGEVRALAVPVDAADVAVWALQARALVGLDAQGAPMAGVDLPPGPPARAFAPLAGNRFAIATARGTRLVDAAGGVLREQRMPGVRGLHPLGAGRTGADGLWAVGRHRLTLLDEQLVPRQAYHLPAQGIGHAIAAATVDPRDDSLWFVAGRKLFRAHADGRLTTHRDLLAYLGTDRVNDLALYADTFPPELVVAAPEARLVTNNDQPDLTLGYDDTGIGVDTDTLNVERDGEAVDGTCETDTETQRIECVIGPFDDGTHTINATVADYAGNESEPAEAIFEIDTVAPTITIEQPLDGAFVNSDQVTVRGRLSETAELSIDGEAVGLGVDDRFEHVVALGSDGPTAIELVAEDGAGNSATRTITVSRDTVAPNVAVTAGVTVEPGEAEGTVRITGADGSAEPEADVVITNTRTEVSIVVAATATGGFVAQIEGELGDIYTVIVRDRAGNESDPQEVTGDPNVPPDPEDIAPPLPAVGIAPFEQQISFLYQGPDAIQQDVAPGTIEQDRVAVLRGEVRDRAGDPIPGVRVTILNHPEFGSTYTQAGGGFDMAVNGGGRLTVEYRKDGFLPVQRRVRTEWNDWFFADDVVMIPLDDRVTRIDLADTSQPFQVARGSVVSDSDGSRQATLLFPAGTTAEITLPDGSKKQLSQLDVRATEYTVGESGPQAMPGELPPTSGYTYAVELSVDQALKQGVKVQGKDVVFSQPVPFYVENFLDFPTGEPVPVGFYNNDTAAWVPYPDGRIVEVIDERDGLAILDVIGDGNEALPDQLKELGITSEERRQLADLYDVGDSVWRTAKSHLSTWDHNWPFRPVESAELPDVPERTSEEPENSDEEEDCEGCSISPQRQSLSESIDVGGTSFSLNYHSDRMAGSAKNRIEIPITDAEPADGLLRVEIEISVAGHLVRKEFSSAPSQNFEFIWDGTDRFGRPRFGQTSARIKISYIFGCAYLGSSAERRRSFARFGDIATPIGGSARCLGFEFSRESIVRLDSPNQSPNTVVGNWDVSVEHWFDPPSGQLFLGDGSTRKFPSRLIDTLSRFGSGGLTADERGRIYVADDELPRIFRIESDGRVRFVAGGGSSGFSGDGGPATDARLDGPSDVALGPDGSLFIADRNNDRVRRVTPDGVIETVAGFGERGFSGDGGPAVEARLNGPTHVAVGEDGTLYISDQNNHRIRWVTPDGIIDTFAGNGERGFSGDGGPAANARLAFPGDLAIGTDGSLYIADRSNLRVRRVGLDGRIETVAGTGELGAKGDGGPARNAQFDRVGGLAVAADGSVFVAGNTVRRIQPDGIIDTVAGNGRAGPVFGSQPARNANLTPADVTIGPDGNLFISDRLSDDIRRVGGFTPASGEIEIPSVGGSRLFVFSPGGVHLRTHDTRTAEVLFRFERDSEARLLRVVNGDGNVTTIERDSSGNVTAIIGPDGQRSDLTLDSRGYLVALADPEGAAWLMEYTDDALLTRIDKPGGAVNRFSYDASGRLVEDVDPNGGGWQISRTKLDDGYRTEMVTGEGRLYRFATERPDNFTRVYTNERPDGTITRRIHTDADTRIEQPDGTVVVTREAPDPRFEFIAPYVAERTIELPSGRVFEETTERAADSSIPGELSSLIALEGTVITNGRRSNAEYDAGDRKWTLESPEDRVTTVRVDGQGRPLEQSTPGLASLHTGYDVSGRLSSITQGTGAEERRTFFSYHDAGSQAGYLASVTDAEGRVVSFETDAVGRVTQQTLPDGRTIGYEYDGRGNLLALTPPGRDAHVFEYDGLDQRTAYTPPDLSRADTITRHIYNLDRQIREIQRPGGEIVTFDYDAGGRLASRRLPVGHNGYGYDALTGQLESITAPGGIGLQLQWDGFLPTGSEWTGPVSGSVEREFDSNFWLTREVVNGSSVEFEYDDDGLLIGAGMLDLGRNPANGLLETGKLAQTGECRSHNPFGELETLSVKTAGEVASLGLDVPETTDSALLSVSGTLPGADRLEINGETISVGDDGEVAGAAALPDIGANVLEIAVFGKVLPSEPLATQTVTVERVEPSTSGEFPVAEIFDVTPDDGIYVRAEDGSQFPGFWLIPRASGVPEQPAWPLVPDEVRVDPAGTVYLRTGTQILDTEGNLIVDFASGGAGVVEEFAVASGGALFARTSAQELFLATDGAIHLLGSLGRALSDSIDIAASAWGVGLLTPETAAQFDESCVPSGGSGGEGDGEFECFSEWFRAFPSFPFALSVSDSGAACYTGSETVNCRNTVEGSRFPGFFAAQFELASDNRLFYLDGNVLLRETVDGEGESVVKGLPASGGGTTTGEMVVTGSVSDGEDLYATEFERDRLGRIVEKTEAIGGDANTWGYEYDQAGRLVKGLRNGTPVYLYHYDANGNRISHTGPAGTVEGSYDAQDRITAYGGATYTHTPAGERASKTTARGTTSYDYDAAGNLRAVTLPDGTEIEYLIDGRDRRVGKKVDGIFKKGWLYRDQLNPVAEVDENGNVTTRFVYADKANVPAYMIQDGTAYWIVSDHLGSVRLVIDTNTNEIVQRMDYSPFGKVITDTNPGLQPFGFAGGLYDRDTGLVRFGARDYDPEIGRWTAKDPIKFRGGDTNLYGYLVNDPINDIDVTGKGPVSAVACGGVAAISKFSNAMAVVDAVEAANAAAAEIEGLRKAKAEQCQSPGDAELIEQRIQELKVQRSKEIAAAAAEGFEFTATVAVAAAVCGSIPFLP